jgi:hypothetical protein
MVQEIFLGGRRLFFVLGGLLVILRGFGKYLNVKKAPHES